MIVLWVLVFLVSLFILVKGADWLIRTSERIGVHFGLSPFVIGVLIVGIGTSLPELFSGLAAVIAGVGEVVTANAVGSNIANILLVVGVSAVIGRKLVVTKDLIDSELPLFIITAILFLGIVYDGSISFLEALLLFAAYLVYLFHSLSSEGEESSVVEEKSSAIKKHVRLTRLTWAVFTASLGGVLIGAYFLIKSAVAIAQILNIIPGLVSITAIAVGTSLPELFVSLKALKQGKSDLAIGNVLGSNAFNILMAVSIPGLFTTLSLDAPTLTIGLPVFAVAAFIFLIVGISKNIYRWEGFMFLLIYVLFLAKLIGIA
jgi:cation:H+ antiporter